MTTEQFYQIASCASMIQDLADKGSELSNAERIINENLAFFEKEHFSDLIKLEEHHKQTYQDAKAKIEERIKAKNEELQKLINQ